MARYVCSFSVANPPEDLHHSLIDVLNSCNFDIIYHTPDYLMAREIPGQISFSKLVTAEILIDKDIIGNNEVRMNLVLKNEELPLQINNHCHQIFDLVKAAFLDHSQWQILDRVG